MGRPPIFSVEQFLGSYQLWATSYMMQAFVAKQAEDEGISIKDAAEKVTDGWYESQLEGFNAQLNAMTAGEFMQYKIQNKVADTEDLRVEFRRVLELASAEIMKMLAPKAEPPEREEKTPGGIIR